MKCEACEIGNHELCGMQTWCDCDCIGHYTVTEGINMSIISDFGEPIVNDVDGGRLVHKPTIVCHRCEGSGLEPSTPPKPIGESLEEKANAFVSNLSIPVGREITEAIRQMAYHLCVASYMAGVGDIEARHNDR